MYKAKKSTYGQFHVFFSPVGHRFSSNFGRALVNQKKVSSQNSSSKKNFLAFLRLFYFSLPFSMNKNFFLQFLHQMLKSIEKNFQKYMIDVKFLKESIPGVRSATRGFPNLKMPKNQFFFIIRYLISHINLCNFFYELKFCLLTFFRLTNALLKFERNR